MISKMKSKLRVYVCVCIYKSRTFVYGEDRVGRPEEQQEVVLKHRQEGQASLSYHEDHYFLRKSVHHLDPSSSALPFQVVQEQKGPVGYKEKKKKRQKDNKMSINRFNRTKHECSWMRPVHLLFHAPDQLWDPYVAASRCTLKWWTSRSTQISPEDMQSTDAPQDSQKI